MKRKPKYLPYYFTLSFLILTWLPLSGNAAGDKDGDGIPDNQDNCIEIANTHQHDSNNDGYGNICDADLNNDGYVSYADLNLFKTAFHTQKSDSDADFNSDGIVSFSDLHIFRKLFDKVPGPSGSGANTDAESLPLLPAGSHISIIRGFNISHPPLTKRNMEVRWDEALSKGMKVTNIQLDWAELEPKPYQYNKQFLEEMLLDMEEDDLQTYVLLSTIDSEGFTLPSDLMDDNSITGLANGMQFDNPLILERFKKLLDWVVPMIVAHGGWALSVGNEPSGYLTDRPWAEQNIVNFLKVSRTHAHSIDPDLAITMTLSQLQIENGATFHIPLLEQSDVASFTYYGLNPDYTADDPAKVNQEINQMLSAAGDKFIVLQELGGSAGYENNSSGMNASLTKQQQFLRNAFAKLESEPRFRVATVFQLVDWEPALVDSFYTQFFIQEGLQRDFIDRFAESLKTTGLIRYQDGSPRPSWNTFINWMGRINGQ